MEWRIKNTAEPWKVSLHRGTRENRAKAPPAIPTEISGYEIAERATPTKRSANCAIHFTPCSSVTRKFIHARSISHEVRKVI